MRGGIVVVDDYFPTVGTGFRIAEFSWLLRRGVVDQVLTTVTPLRERIGWYSAAYPQIWERIRPYSAKRLADFDLAYVLFLNNADHHLAQFERLNIPFVLTLYPGGGLYLGNPESEAKLDRVLGSNVLAHVITTQPIVTDRVRAAVAARVGVTEIRGVVVDPSYLSPGAAHRADYYGLTEGRGELNVCFVAHKYAERGADKGFPEFVETVALLRRAGVPVRARVVGGFSEGDLLPNELDLGLEFLGELQTIELREFYLTQDFIISPVRPDLLAPGSFDGFPTGATVEAGLCGVAMVATDELHQNSSFIDGRDILIVAPRAADIAQRIRAVIDRPGELRRLAQSGLAAVRREYSIDRQLWTRRSILEGCLAKVRPDAVADASVSLGERR